jgi:hypothetical protein
MKRLFLILWCLSLSTLCYGSNSTSSDEGSLSPRDESLNIRLATFDGLNIDDNKMPTSQTESDLSESYIHIPSDILSQQMMPSAPQLRPLQKHAEDMLPEFFLLPAVKIEE